MTHVIIQLERRVAVTGPHRDFVRSECPWCGGRGTRATVKWLGSPVCLNMEGSDICGATTDPWRNRLRVAWLHSPDTVFVPYLTFTGELAPTAVTIQLEHRIELPPPQRFLIAAHCTGCGRQGRFINRRHESHSMCRTRIELDSDHPLHGRVICGEPPPWPWVPTYNDRHGGPADDDNPFPGWSFTSTPPQTPTQSTPNTTTPKNEP